MESKVLKILKDRNRLGLDGVLPIQALIMIQVSFCTIYPSRLQTENLEEEVENYLKKTLLHSCEKNTSICDSILHFYLKIYDTQNYYFKQRNNKELFYEFMNICFDVLIKNYHSKSKFTMITTRYKVYLKSLRKKENLPEKVSKSKYDTRIQKKEVTPKEKNRLQENGVENVKEIAYVYKKYFLHKEYLAEILNALEKTEKTEILCCKKESELIEKKSIIEKIEYGLRYYPMTRFLTHTFLERHEELKRFMKQKHFIKDIQQKQNLIFKTMNENTDIVVQEIYKLSKKDSEFFQILRVFLGDSTNNVSYIELEEKVKSWIASFQEKDLSYYQFSNYFSLQDVARARVIVECFKNEYPEYYEVLIQKYGKCLYEYHLLSSESEQLCQEAIRKIHNLISYEKQGLILIDEQEFFIRERKEEKEDTKEPLDILSNLSDEEKIWARKQLEKMLSKQHSKSLMHMTKTDDIPFLNRSLLKLKSFHPTYYETLITCHGSSLIEWKEENPEEYKVALKKLKFFLSKDSFLSQEKEIAHLKLLYKNLSLEEKRIIHEKRHGLDTYFLSKKYHKTPEELYQLFASSLSFFGSLVPYIVKEILLE